MNHPTPQRFTISTRNVHKLTIWLGALALAAACVQLRAVDFPVATAQDLQNALTQAAANGADNNIYITNGYYVGNFNYNSSGANSLTILPAAGVTNTQITIDGAGTGRAVNISCSADANITVQGITFLRNCGSTTIGALRIAGGGGATILVNGCRFLEPTNSSGMGLELASGLNATVTNCTATGVKTGGGGTGMSISVTGNAAVQNCTVTTNNVWGISVSGGVIAITANTFTGNSVGASCNGTVTLTGNIFTGNSGGGNGGGGVQCYGPSAMLTGNIFTGNSAYGAFGGGVVIDGAATLSGNTFSGNSAGVGGGALLNGYSTVTGNTFTGNSVNAHGGYGGGLAMVGGTVTGNTFIGNSASSDYPYPCYGGGLFIEGGTVTGNTFEQNSAGTSGGGIYAAAPTITISDNLLAQNTSSSGGGIWVNASSSLFLINNTITGNNSTGIGGGVTFQVSGVVELLNVYNNIIWGNTASGSGADVYLTGTGKKKLFLFNDVDTNGMSGVWDVAADSIDVAPQFFDPVNGDYHIKGTSPCKDTGTNGAPSLPATDLDGGPRIANGTVDLGCYEFSTAATHPADTDTNFVITAAEFNAYAAAWKAGQGWTNGPNPISADYVTRAGYLMTNSSGVYHNDGSARPVNWKTGP